MKIDDYLAVVFPAMPAGQRFTLVRPPHLINNEPLVAMYVVTVLLAGGHYVGYSYIEPFLAQVSGFGDLAITLALVAFGTAGLVGSRLFSRLYDSHWKGFLTTSLVLVPSSLLLLLPAAISPVATVVA